MKNNNLINFKINWKEKRNIPIGLFLIYFFFVLVFYLKQYTLKEIVNPNNLAIIFVWFALSFLYIVKIKAVRSFFYKYGSFINILALLLSVGVSFLTVEFMAGNFNPTMFRKYSLFNLVWYALIYLFVYAVTRNYKLTIMLAGLLIYLASMLNYFVLIFRGNPVLPSDLLAWRTGVSVATGYELQFTKGFVFASLLFLLLLVLADKLETRDKSPSVLNRLIGCAGYLILAVVVFNEFFNTELIQSKIRVIDYFAPKYTYSEYGTAFGFVANINALITKSPDGYSVEKVEEAFNNLGEKPDTASVKPNIIVIMNEAFSDLSMVGDYKTNMDYLPNFRALTTNTIKGHLYVSVFGGGTSDTEYEFLTGNSMAVMPANSVPYQQFVTSKTDSLASTLKAQGYYNIAIHPYEKSGYKRDIVYPLLGFDEFLSQDDFKNPGKIRSFISDKESYKKIIEEYETKGKDDPLFIFNVTMQDHGGYSDSELFGPEDNVKFTDMPGYGSAEQYLSLLRKSDQAFQMLVDYFSKQKEPTIILLYGDHQPIAFSGIHDELEKQNPDLETLAKKYQVPFVLWANYDIGEKYVDKISANYLSSYLLNVAGVEGSEYNQYLMNLYDKLPVINGLFYIDRNNDIYRLSDASDYSDLIKQYQIVGYNNALDKKNRLKQFYALGN
jgi:phosphoglycerol transferase MdoB-like AlkP superfamily enzyme